MRELVNRYLALAGDFGRPAALADFGFSRAETEKLFSALDEDYHISRFLKFTFHPAAPAGSFSINSFPQSHLIIDAGIETIL